MKRREFLQVVGAGTAAAIMPAVAHAEAPKWIELPGSVLLVHLSVGTVVTLGPRGPVKVDVTHAPVDAVERLLIEGHPLAVQTKQPLHLVLVTSEEGFIGNGDGLGPKSVYCDIQDRYLLDEESRIKFRYPVGWRSLCSRNWSPRFSRLDPGLTERFGRQVLVCSRRQIVPKVWNSSSWPPHEFPGIDV